MEITELQKDLAATFRWTARLNMHEGVANHFSACIPDSSTDFYVNRAGIHFSQIKASDLILVTKKNIKELKNKKAGPANHSLTTFLQKQGVMPYTSKIVKNDTTPTACI